MNGVFHSEEATQDKVDKGGEVSFKKRILFVVSGIAVELFVLWLIQRVAHLNFVRQIIWRDFLIGFLTASWLVLWFRLMNKLFSKKPKGAQPTEQKQAPVSAAPVQVPRRIAPMAVQNKAILNIAPQAPTTPSGTPTPTPAMTPAPATAPSPAALKEKDILTLADIDPDLDMMAFKHVALEGKVIDLVYSSDDVAVLCKIFSENHTWTVDTSQSIENCTWTDETGNTVQPCLPLLTQAAILEKMESDAEIIPSIVLVRGSVQNIEQVKNYLLQNQITLVKYKKEETEDIQTLHELLKDNFSLFPAEDEQSQEESNETPSE